MSDAAVEPNVVELDCYYSLSSPWAYLAGPQPRDIVPASPEAYPQTVRLAGRGPKDRRRALAHASAGAPALPSSRARSLAPLPRHAPGLRTSARSAGAAGRSRLEQTRKLDRNSR